MDAEGSAEGVGDAREHNASGSLGTVLDGGDDRLARPRAPGQFGLGDSRGCARMEGYSEGGFEGVE